MARHFSSQDIVSSFSIINPNKVLQADPPDMSYHYSENSIDVLWGRHTTSVQQRFSQTCDNDKDKAEKLSWREKTNPGYGDLS